MERAYERYFNAMPCYLTVQDQDFHILDANRRFSHHFGDWQGRYCYQVYKHRSEKCEECPVEKAFWDGRSHRSEERVRCLDGKEVSVLVEATPILNGDGEITRVMEMSTDVTLIKRMEEQLRESRKRYQVLFEEVPCYITVQDPELRILDTNRKFREDFGDSLGRHCYKAYKHRDEECIPCPVRQTFRDGEIRTREEVVASSEKEPIHVLVTTAPIHDAEGKIVSVMEFSANITQIRELESQLTNLGLLIGSVSHGLKGLLNGLAGGMYLVNTGFKKEDDGRIQQGWEIVERNVGKIRNMVSDILYYAKPREPNWETLQLSQVCREAWGVVKDRVKELDISPALDFEEVEGQFEGDGQAIRSLLVNILENSIDACRLDSRSEGNQITFEARSGAEYVEFEIADDGIGMDQETRDKVFSLFFSSKGREGTGLGLFISNKIAAAHGGDILLSSEPGKGSSFVVRIPVSRERSKSVKKGSTRVGDLSTPVGNPRSEPFS